MGRGHGNLQTTFKRIRLFSSGADAIAAEFGKPLTEIAFAILLTLAMRPVGALLFGRAADR
jgi:hypothetical protein